MATVSAADVAKNFGEWHDKALNEPVVVTKYGRESVVVLSVDTFRQLTSHYREVVDTSEIDDILAASIEHSDIPEEYRWNSTDDVVPDLRRGT
jgi:PHD/YefM family antitoxin component YafN of YafNO toxin-antitoxin module